MTRSRVLALVSLLLVARTAAAQERKAGQWLGSGRAASVQLSDTQSVGALGGVLEYRVLPWLSFGAAPTFVRSSSGPTTASGFGDLPLAISASSESGAPLHPELGTSVIMTLPTGNAACGLGSGATSVGAQLAAGIAPSDAVHLSAEASRSFSGGIALSALSQPGATWLDFDGDVDVAPRWTMSLSAGSDVGGTKSGTTDREVGGGVSYALGSLNLSLDVTHGVGGLAPHWGVALSLGTSSSGISSLNSLTPLGRQHQSIVSGLGRGGRGGTGSGTTGC
jgi:hypothetical protein